jgi:hypothetical protein
MSESKFGLVGAVGSEHCAARSRPPSCADGVGVHTYGGTPRRPSTSARVGPAGRAPLLRHRKIQGSCGSWSASLGNPLPKWQTCQIPSCGPTWPCCGTGVPVMRREVVRVFAGAAL